MKSWACEGCALIPIPWRAISSLFRSIRIRTDHFVAGDRVQRDPDAGGDRVLDEPHRPVAEQGVHPAGVLAPRPSIVPEHRRRIGWVALTGQLSSWVVDAQ